MPPKTAPTDLTDTLGSGGTGDIGDFPPPSAQEWEKINAGSSAAGDGNDEPDAGDLDTDANAGADAGAEAPADDPDIALPDGTTVKLSEIQALRGNKTATPPTPPPAAAERTVAQERADLQRAQREFTRQQEQHKEALREILKDPAKLAEVQRAAGINLEPNPISDQQKWVNYRYQQYINAGWKPEEVTREKLVNDLYQAQSAHNARELATLRSTIETQQREADDRKHFDSVTGELEGLYARPEFAEAATPEGRDLVDALLAQADRDGNDVSLEDVVRKVHEYGAKLVSKYAGVKTDQRRATAGLMRGGGSHRAPEPKDYGSGYDGFGRIARDRIKGGA